MTPNNRKRLVSEYNSSPDNRNDQHAEDGRYKLTLSQFATSASEQEPLYPDDEDVEEILMRLRHGHDYYRPKAILPPPMNRHYPNYHSVDNIPSYPSVTPSPNKASLFHILSQENDSVNSRNTLPSQYSPVSVNNNLHIRKMLFEDGLMESDEMGLEHPKKKARRENSKSKSPLKSIIVNTSEDVQERETVAAGLCFKTHKPKVQREYYYAKLSKTIFRWTCCGSQAKTHPDA